MTTRQSNAQILRWEQEIGTICVACGTIRYGSEQWDAYVTRINTLNKKIAALEAKWAR